MTILNHNFSTFYFMFDSYQARNVCQDRLNSKLNQQWNQNLWGPKRILQLSRYRHSIALNRMTHTSCRQCSRSQLYLSQWGKYFHKTLSLWSSFQLKSVSLTRGQRELQDSCCWRINVLNETWDWAAGTDDHHWKTLTYEGLETLKCYFYFTFPGQMLLWVVLL